jgi:SSS family solute:Na+ symporter
MSGSGFALGLAIASYEWMAAFTLIIVGNILPIFYRKGIYTIPEFVKSDFQLTLKRFWPFLDCLICFVNLTTVLYLGGLAIETMVCMMYAIGLALCSSLFIVWRTICCGLD